MQHRREDEKIQQVLSGFEEYGSRIRELEEKVLVAKEKLIAADNSYKEKIRIYEKLQEDNEYIEVEGHALNEKLGTIDHDINAERNTKESLLLELCDGMEK